MTEQNRPIRKIEQLESFENCTQVINLLSFQQSFSKFLLTIKNIIGASLHVHSDCTTSIAFKGKPIEGTRKMRFNTPEELNELIKMAGLN